MLLAQHGRIAPLHRKCSKYYTLSSCQWLARACRSILKSPTMRSSASSTAEASTSYELRVVGSVLGAMCGDALGASVEGWSPERIQSAYPEGLQAFQDTDRGFGCYTDDNQMLLALAASLINRQRCDAADAAQQYAKAFDPKRGYGGSAVKVLTRLSQGADPATTATQFLPGGSFANGGAMRIAPVGLAYRNADAATMQKAVEAALLCTHVHPLGVEGALAQALAVAELSRMQLPAAPAAADAAHADGLPLLRSLQVQLASSEEVAGKLQLLEQALREVPADSPSVSGGWRQYLQSPGWQHELAVSHAVAPGFQIKATDAAAAALWAVVRHWRSPADALVAAVHYGGDTDTIACMAGAMMGALHGTSWLPQQWLSNLENASRPPSSNLGDHGSFFNTAAVDALLAGEDACRKGCGAAAEDPAAAIADADAGGGAGGDVVYTTRDMGRESAMQLARLLARLDCTAM